jgi:hypothetical protein
MDMNQINQPSQTNQPAAAPAPQDMDISKTTITILVLLTLMISVIGTWTVLNEISNVKVTKQSAPASAQVSLTLLDGPRQPSADSVTGRVVLNVQ